MPLNKAQSVFDSTTVANGDSVAAYLFASARLTSQSINSLESLNTFAAIADGAGTALTSTLTGGKQALDVNIASPISVATDLDGFYNVGTNPTPDTVGSIFCTRAATPALTDQIQRVTAGAASSDGVVAANVHALDTNGFLMGFNGTTWDRLKSTSGALNVAPSGNVADDGVDSGNPVKVGSRALSGLLAAISTTGDRADLISDMYRRVFTNDAPNVANKLTTTTIGVAAAKVVTTPLGGRTRILLQANGNKPIYIGADNTVTADVGTATSGFIIPAHGGTLELPSGQGLDWYAISDTAAQKLTVIELG